jgi:hypothetical protein
LRSRGLPQHRQTVGPGSTIRAADVRKGLARRALAGKDRHIGGLGHRPLGRDLVLSRGTLELLEGQLHLVEQPHGAFRVLAIELARQLGDLQPLMRDQGLIVDALTLANVNSASTRAALSRSTISAAISSRGEHVNRERRDILIAADVMASMDEGNTRDRACCDIAHRVHLS